MRERWRYVLPCGHHGYVKRTSNPPARRYYCDNCGAYHARLIDKKHNELH